MSLRGAIFTVARCSRSKLGDFCYMAIA